jgi:hypothetical protein
MYASNLKRCDSYIGTSDNIGDAMSYNSLLGKTGEEIFNMTAFEREHNGAGANVKLSLTESAKASLNRIKNTAMRDKAGKLVLTTIKSAVKNAPGFPEQAKPYVDSKWADLALGVIVSVGVPALTKSPKALRLAEDVSIASGVKVSEGTAFIETFVGSVIDAIAKVAKEGGLGDLFEGIKEEVEAELKEKL